MKRESLITKLVAFMLCVMMVVGCLPVSAFAAENDWEGDIDVVEPPVGSQENPATVEWVWNEAQTEATATVTVPANSTMYFQDWSLSAVNVLTANGETVEVTYGSPRMTPSTWNIANATDADVEYTLVLTYVVGSMQNPQAIDYFDAQTASIEAGDQDGYYFIYTADCTGKVKISVDSTVGWTYTIENLTSGVYGSAQYSSDADSVVDTFDVAADDEIRIIVNTFNPDDQWNNPAGDVTVSLEKLTGYCPVCAAPLYPDMTVVNAGTVYYQGRFGGQIVTFTGDCDFTVSLDGADAVASSDGKVELTVPVAAGFPQPANSIVITGDGNITVTTAYPAGHMENPAAAVLGDNVADIAAGGSEYVWNYTAEKDGDLVVTISSSDGNWQYAVSNITTYVYGDAQWSDSDPVVNPTTITVKAGDVIEIKVITYNPSGMPWDPAPEGTITTNLAYGCAHANTTTTNTATCTEAGVETVVCDDCGETISETEVPALGHDYTGEHGACAICGEYQVDETLVFFNKSMVLGADIRGIFMVQKIKASSPYESFKVIVEKNGVETELELAATNDFSKQTIYGYALTVPAKEMADIVNAKIIGIKADGTYCVSNPDAWSIKIGAISLMDGYAAKTDADSQNRLKMIANMLHYGAEAQKRFGYNLDNLATDDLKDEYAALIIKTPPTLNSMPTVDDTGAQVPLYDIAFNLDAKVEIVAMFTVPKADAKESYSADIIQTHTAPDGTVMTKEYTINGADCLKYGTIFGVYINNLESDEMRDVLSVTVKKDGAVVSATHTFSGESALVKGLLNTYPDLANALMNYCDCAYTVFGSLALSD